MQIHGDSVRVGVHSGQQYSRFEDCLALWRRAEDLRYDWVSAFDHLRPPLGGASGPCFEGTTMLAALAARTSTIRCGLLVSAVTWRHPAIAAIAASTIDHISGGRLEFGIGAGSADLGYQQFGIPFPPDHLRMEMLDEACQVMRGLWTHDSTTFRGKHYRLEEAHAEPKPLQAHLPLIIGGAGERRTLRIVAQHGDIWNTLAGSLLLYRRKLEALERHCAAVSRAPHSIRKSVTFRAVLSKTRQEAPHRKRQVLAALPDHSPDLDEYLTFGTADDCIEDLRGYVELGVRDFLLGVRPPIDWETFELMGSTVAPALHALAV